jgi:Flp pilus assembly pilin Flp
VASSIEAADRWSAPGAFAAVCGVWIGMSLVCTAGYWHLAALSGHRLLGLVLASVFPIQAVFVGVYAWRARFSTEVGAAIQSASAAVAVVGFPAIAMVATLTTISTTLHSVWLQVYPFDLGYVSTHGFQFAYIATVLLLSGLVGGTALGVLRWRILQSQSVAGRITVSSSIWNRYLRAATAWGASITVYSWLGGAISWANSWRPYPQFNDSLLAEVLLGIGGLSTIALGPVLFRKSEPTNRTGRLLRHSMTAMLSVAILAGFEAVATALYSVWGASSSAIPRGAAGAVIAIMYYPFVLYSYGLYLALPCLLWAVLYDASGPSPKEKFPEEIACDSRVRRGRKSNWSPVWLATIGLVSAFFAGLLATAPVSLGVHGIGCLTVAGVHADGYWFWKAYKGLGSEASTGDGMVFRPKIDPSVCMTLNDQSIAKMDDPKERSKGYLAAAYVWAWLIDPEQWDAERGMQIRVKLKRLLGRDFSSYQELKEWGRNNSAHLEWSGTDERLEVRQSEESDSVFTDFNNEVFFGLRTHVREPYYLAQPNKKPVLVPSFFSTDAISVFPALPLQSSWLYFDRQAQLRGLKLDAASCIDILTGEQQRRVQEYLHNFFGGDLSTREQWQKFFTRPNPEDMPYGDWHEAQVVFSLYDDPEEPRSQKPAMDWLSAITLQTFDSPEAWVQWWEASHTKLVLSEDGRGLVVGK